MTRCHTVALAGAQSAARWPSRPAPHLAHGTMRERDATPCAAGPITRKGYMDANELPLPKAGTGRSPKAAPARRPSKDFVFGDFNDQFVVLPRSVRFCGAHRKDTAVTPSYSDLRDALPLFGAFPYLNIRVVPTLYHIILLPAGVPEARLLDTARWQAQANQLPLCLVLAPDRAVYCEPEGASFVTSEPPLGGILTTGGLVPAIDCDDASEEFRARQKQLADEVDRLSRRGGCLLGDLTKGGRAASDEEKQRLEGTESDGTPRGLSRCVNCRHWKGVCLDPSKQCAGQVMPVHCYCDNHNRCARCDQRLYARRLNANYYDPRDGCIWHVPGFCGLRHRCSVPELSRRSA